jgi:putative tryptophan/tyrosine transport system substrate-binding protein
VPIAGEFHDRMPVILPIAYEHRWLTETGTGWDFVAREGGLMSYSMDLDEGLGRMASLIDQVLKGARLAELPFEQPTCFRFVLNLKTAKTIGLDVPAAMLARADEVIE